MAGEKKAPVKLIIGIWGSLALFMGLIFAFGSWVNPDHKTMGGLAVFVRSSDVQVADDQAETDPEFDHELADLHGARKGVAVQLERDLSLEATVRDLLTREGCSVVDDARQARFVAEIGLAPWKPGSSVARLHSLRLWDARDNCLVSFMSYSQRGPFLTKPQEVGAGALLDFYKYYDGLALRRGRDEAFFSPLTATADASRPGEVFYESRPDLGRPRQRAFVAFIERDAEYAGAAAPDAEAMFYRSLHKAGWDVAMERNTADVLVQLKWTYERWQYTDGSSGYSVWLDIAASSPTQPSAPLEISVAGSSPSVVNTGSQSGHPAWRKSYEEQEPAIITLIERVAAKGR